VTEQLRTVPQQIAEFQLLERQLAQVLQRLRTTPLASHADGCQCLGNDTPETQESHPLPLSQKGAVMPTSTLEPLTFLAPSPLSANNGAGDVSCGCGCGASLTQFTLPQAALKDIGDQQSAQPTGS
jgi:hypothetical protein